MSKNTLEQIIGDNVAKYRNLKGLTQLQLAGTGGD